MDNKKNLIIIIFSIVVLLGAGLLVYFLSKNNTVNNNASNVSVDVKEVSFDNSDEYYITLDESVTISKAGVYYLSGTLDGSITVNTDGDVKLVLDSVSINNSNGAAINVENANVVYIEIKGDNTISATISDEEIDGAIFTVCDLVLTGDGTLNINSNSNGIKTKGDLLIESGTYNITSDGDSIHSSDSLKINGGTINIESKDDGLRANDVLEINDGKISINATEGIEGTYVKINGGTISISASDDGINATNKTDNYTPTVEINGGNITIKMAQGDTDGIDSNGNLYINGGTITIDGQSAFDYDLEAKYTGGKMIINGEETTTITNQFGGGMGGMNNGTMRGGQQMTPPSGEEGNQQMTPPDNSNGNQQMTPPDGSNNTRTRKR